MYRGRVEVRRQSLGGVRWGKGHERGEMRDYEKTLGQDIRSEYKDGSRMPRVAR